MTLDSFLHLLFVSSADHLLPLLIFTFFQQTPHLQLLIIVRCFFNVFTLIFIGGVQVFVVLLSTPRCNVSGFTTPPTCSVFSRATFLLPCASFLATALLARFLPPRFACCHLCSPDILLQYNSEPFQNSVSFACSIVYGLQREIRVSLVYFSQFFTIIFCRHPNLRGSTRVNLPVSGCRDRCNVVDDDVLQLRDKLTVRLRRSSESVIQQALRHQFLDCAHLFLISDCAESVLSIARLIDERPQDVVELLHIFGCLTESPYNCVPRFESLLSSCLLD